MDLEIVILPDGSLMIERGTKAQNNQLHRLLGGFLTDDSLHQFISLLEGSELVFGSTTLCG